MARIPNDMVKGTEFESTNYGVFKVIEYINSRNIKVQFTATGYITIAHASSIRRGQVKDYYHPIVEGVGYLGKGDYNPTRDKKAYNTWRSMFTRCYSSKSLIRYPNYRGCTVVREWHCFQDFAPWFYANYIDGYHLDKDIIGTSKEYSPSNCIFVAVEDNTKKAKGTLGTVWVLTSIGGEEVVVNNQATFAEENGLDRGNLSKLCAGKVRTCKGFKLKEVIKPT